MKLLLVQTAFLGDIVLATPLIKSLKNIYPDAELWFLTTPKGKELLEGNNNITGIITFDKRGQYSGFFGLIRFIKKIKSFNFDRVYSLHKSYRTALLLYLAKIPKRIAFQEAKLSFLYTKRIKLPKTGHAVERNLALLDDQNVSDELDLHVSKENINSDLVSSVLKQDRPIAVVSPGSVWKTKRWYAEGYHQVAKELIKDYQVVVIGSKEEQDIAEVVCDDLAVQNLTGLTSLRESMYLISQAKLLVCNDSMTQHLGSAFKIPTVVIFCATSPSFGFGPWKNSHKIVEKEGLSCKPCARHGSNACPVGTEACMRELAPVKVISAIKELTANASN